MPRRQRRRHGFSLFELAIVLAVVSIISAIAIPRYSSSLENYHASFAAHKIAADIALAQSTARATSSSQTLTFAAGGLSYSIAGVVGLDAAAGAYSVDLSQPPFLSSASADFAATLQVTFNGYGAPNNAGTITVRSGRAVRTVTMDGQSGACRIN